MTVREIHILILHHQALPAEQIKEICAGLEEEGVPYLLQPNDELANSIDLAAAAASKSPLHIGIGIDRYETVCVQHEKLAAAAPYLTGDLRDGRKAGKNAARLVKGLPLAL